MAFIFQDYNEAYVMNDLKVLDRIEALEIEQMRLRNEIDTRLLAKHRIEMELDALVDNYEKLEFETALENTFLAASLRAERDLKYAVVPAKKISLRLVSDEINEDWRMLL